MGRATTLALATLCLVAPVRAGDRVELKDGSTVEGRVVFEGNGMVVVRVGSRDREVDMASVQSVRSVARSLREALDQWEQVAAGDDAAILELARFCKSRELEGEARVLAHRVLGFDPSNEAAHLLCGHEHRSQGWFVRDGRKRVPFEKVLESSRVWKDAWQLQTTHYSVRSNLDLVAATELALELELFYRTFFEWFGEELALYEVTEAMHAYVYADSDSFPEWSGHSAYFMPAVNILHADGSQARVLSALAHEATHQLLYNTAVRTRGGRGEIPAWLDEGLAEYVGWSRQGDRGRPRYSKGAIAEAHFARHAAAKKPYDLSRVLTFATEDFIASSNADLKYAQSYTLVHYLLHGENGAHRVGFFEFLRGAYLGKASTTDFKAAIAIDGREFEKAWQHYAETGG